LRIHAAAECRKAKGLDPCRVSDEAVEYGPGGALPVVVTLMGSAALLKGVTLLLVASERIADAYKGVGFQRFFQAWTVAVLAIGLWVTAMAFTA
jgi:hypothetical protein